MLTIPPNHSSDDRSDCNDEDKDHEDGFFLHRGEEEKLQDAAFEWRASRIFCQVPVPSRRLIFDCLIPSFVAIPKTNISDICGKFPALYEEAHNVPRLVTLAQTSNQTT